MGISTFELASWVETRSPEAKYNLAGSACPGISIKDIIKLSRDPQTTASNLDFSELKLNYNSFNSGQEKLKQSIASLFNTPVQDANILSTIGTSIANHIVLQALLQAGDHVVCVHPTYSQLYAIPSMLGADVSHWRLRVANNWQLEYSELEGLIRDNTKMIIVNNPNNPTGSFLDDDLQRKVIALAKKHNITVLADEIFRPLYHSTSTAATNGATVNGTTSSSSSSSPTKQAIPKSFLDHAHDLNYTQVVVTGSTSKSWSTPGLRLGWIASRNDTIIQACTNLRLYMVNSISPIDELIAAELLSPRCRPQIAANNLVIAQAGLDALDKFVQRSSQFQKYQAEWIRPQASSTTLIRFVYRDSQRPLDDVKLCRALFEQERALLIPASLCFDMVDLGEQGKGWMRVGFVSGEASVTACLDRVEKFLETYQEK